MYLKKIFIILFCLFSYGRYCFANQTIEAENNAFRHNNQGILYLKEKYYFGAIKEFKIAIDLLPNSQATAVYYSNLGRTYEEIGYPELARPCFEKAVSINVLCFDYYLKLAQNYKKLDIVNEKLLEFQNKTDSPLSQIMVGLLFIQKGDVSTGVTVLDDFCDKEPNLLITIGIKEYLSQITKTL